MDLTALGKTILILGALLIGLGLIFVLAGRIPFLGRLPGDISFTRGNVRVFFPIVTMIVISVVLTIFAEHWDVYWKAVGEDERKRTDV